MDLRELERSTLAELDELYCRAPAADFGIPRGCYDGTHLCRVDRPGARRRLYLGTLAFSLVPFGVDFDHRRWFFGGRRRLAMGAFEPRIAPSRWRAVEVVALHYDLSRLPWFVRRLLYDEVKPLSDELCLGLGGVQNVRGDTDHFFFALRRR